MWAPTTGLVISGETSKQGALREFKFNDGEVINAKYVTLAEFNNMIKNKKTHDWLKYFNELYEEIF